MPIEIFNKKIDIAKWLGLGGQPKALLEKDVRGYTRTTGPNGEVVDCDTLQCCHCGAHWEVVVGSGRLRGRCHRCDGYVCGAPACMMFCLPKDERLQNLEAGRPELYIKPVAQIAVPKLYKGE